MKFVISLAVLAFAVTFVSARCIYSGGSNKPNCKADSDPKKKYHHNYNANAYFYCDGVEAKVQSCGDKCFYGTECVPCDPNSRHIPVCNETEQDNQAPEDLNETTKTVIAAAGPNEQVNEVTEQGYEATETEIYRTEPETEPNAIGSDNEVPEELNETAATVVSEAADVEIEVEESKQNNAEYRYLRDVTQPETETDALKQNVEVSEQGHESPTASKNDAAELEQHDDLTEQVNDATESGTEANAIESDNKVVPEQLNEPAELENETEESKQNNAEYRYVSDVTQPETETDLAEEAK